MHFLAVPGVLGGGLWLRIRGGRWRSAGEVILAGGGTGCGGVERPVAGTFCR